MGHIFLAGQAPFKSPINKPLSPQTFWLVIQGKAQVSLIKLTMGAIHFYYSYSSILVRLDSDSEPAIRGPGGLSFIHQSNADHLITWRKPAFWDRSHKAVGRIHICFIRAQTTRPICKSSVWLPGLLVPLATCPVFAYSHCKSQSQWTQAHWHIYQAANQLDNHQLRLFHGWATRVLRLQPTPTQELKLHLCFSNFLNVVFMSLF